MTLLSWDDPDFNRGAPPDYDIKEAWGREADAIKIHKTLQVLSSQPVQLDMAAIPLKDMLARWDDVRNSVVSIMADDREGKGFIIDGEGKIATNFHLVNSSSRIKVITPSGDVFLGKVVRLDEKRDLALVQIPTKTSHYRSLGGAGVVDVGGCVFVFGGGSGKSEMSSAVITALRSIGGTALIQVDRAIDPANTGSPFVTDQGAAVGIASYRLSRQDENAGFGVSVKELKAFLSGQ